ncbi:ORF28 [White sturgeon adenovirus 1]|uniref:ORF28 n=1 Tax=White sturgeon adenovirus 1 TaxID=2580388 RepID=A0A4P8PK82_9ADEN|nr:ORF28 [White sturgeon adenovirus 1]QCQ84166.1 ORF28 [White sturgeon adenovirus 1]
MPLGSFWRVIKRFFKPCLDCWQAFCLKLCFKIVIYSVWGDVVDHPPIPLPSYDTVHYINEDNPQDW